MSLISDKINQILQENPAAPFLFIGSGFSRRYLDLPDWRGLLDIFCKEIKEFNYYFSGSNGDLPLTASHIAEDFHEWWWNSEATATSREEFSKNVTKIDDPLKYEISKFLLQRSSEIYNYPQNKEEISDISEITVDGIITTNWDTLIENIFPDYKVYVGQDELLFSHPQSIGEIYKIHGSASDPKSLILTEKDYKYFSEKNPYLAAKLITIFVEHPIIFIGYSITDAHIKSIIISIAKCLDKEKIEIFQDNLIFIQYSNKEEDQKIETTSIQIDGYSISILTIHLFDYKSLYAALKKRKRKLPARMIRFFKEQFYELLKNPYEATTKISVIDIDQINDNKDVEFVIGVGVAKNEEAHQAESQCSTNDAIAKKGYSGVTADDIFVDFLLDESIYNPLDLLESAYPTLSKSRRLFIPVYKYLRLAGIDSEQKLLDSDYDGAKRIIEKLNKCDYTMSIYAKKYKRDFQNLDSAEIIKKSSTKIEAARMLGFQSKSTMDKTIVWDFIKSTKSEFDLIDDKTPYRKLVCLYDRITFGIE